MARATRKALSAVVVLAMVRRWRRDEDQTVPTGRTSLEDEGGRVSRHNHNERRCFILTGRAGRDAGRFSVPPSLPRTVAIEYLRQMNFTSEELHAATHLAMTRATDGGPGNYLGQPEFHVEKGNGKRRINLPLHLTIPISRSELVQRDRCRMQIAPVPPLSVGALGYYRVACRLRCTLIGVKRRETVDNSCDPEWTPSGRHADASGRPGMGCGRRATSKWRWLFRNFSLPWLMHLALSWAIRIRAD